MIPRRRLAKETEDPVVGANEDHSVQDEPKIHDATTWQRLRRKFLPRKRTVFPYVVGILFGGICCLMLLGPVPQQLAQLTLLLEEYDFPSLSVLSDLDYQAALPWNPMRLLYDGREFNVGAELAQQGHIAKHPVILIPGVISTGLESWSTAPEYRQYFRKRYWGGRGMVERVVQSPEKWIAALMLDPETGLDPPGAKLRAAQGIDAAQNFIEGYWIWEKIIQNLASLNYDTNNLELAAYDWRLSYWNLEERDSYFSRLKASIESFKKREGRKSVLVGHSMGSTVVLYFLKWVEAPAFGDGGPNWVEDHIESFVSIAGTHLGVAKSMAAFLSGEMRDTVQMSPTGAFVLEKFFSKKERAKLFRSWAGSASMWIKGGATIWGNETHAPDDVENTTHTHGLFLSFRTHPPPPLPHVLTKPDTTNMTVDDAATWILSHMPTSYQRMLETNYSYGIERNEANLKANDNDHTKWTNPLESQLPNAPSMKIFCIYGHGLPTERSYWYARGEYEHDETFADSAFPQCSSETDCTSARGPLDLPLARKNWIDSEVNEDSSIPKIKNGVKLGEGDGTVSLVSLGAMCVEGWKRKRWNPAGIKVITTEVPHNPEKGHLRGGATSGDHIDVLGSTAVNTLVAKVASGRGDEIEDSFVSDIREYSKKIRWD